jgi:uncharacterized protein (TIRG00374 family)
MSKTVSRWLRAALTIAIIGGLVLFARSVNWSQTWEHITAANRRILVAAAIVNLFSLVIKGVRWWIFLRPAGAPSLWLALRATFAGAGLNNILVAQGGEAARVVFVARTAHVQSARILASLALERLFELIGYVVMFVVIGSFLQLPSRLAPVRPGAWLALVLAVTLMIYLIRRPHLDEIEMPETQPDGWRARVREFFRHFGAAVGGISTAPRFIVALVLSVANVAMQVWTYMLTARAADFNLSLVGTVSALLAVNIGFAIRATPGNVGVFQALYALVATAFGMDRDQALAVAFLIQTQQIIPVTLIGVALAPEFIFRRHGRRASDSGLELHSRAEEVG